jgi:hypothetical protein
VALVAEKEELLENVVRLRRAQAAVGGSADLRAVLSFMERRLGPTVKRARAARALGVSQPALERWIASGDIPMVPTPAGRGEVPTGALVELVRAVRERATAGDHHPLGGVLRERRVTAEQLDVDSIVHSLPRSSDGHRRAERRSLAYHRAVARRLDEDLVERARQRLALWMDERKIDHRYAELWASLLARPLSEIAEEISRDDEVGRDLRQNSPFAGALSEPERRRVLAAAG